MERAQAPARDAGRAVAALPLGPALAAGTGGPRAFGLPSFDSTAAQRGLDGHDL